MRACARILACLRVRALGACPYVSGGGVCSATLFLDFVFSCSCCGQYVDKFCHCFCRAGVPRFVWDEAVGRLREGVFRRRVGVI